MQNSKGDLAENSTRDLWFYCVAGNLERREAVAVTMRSGGWTRFGWSSWRSFVFGH